MWVRDVETETLDVVESTAGQYWEEKLRFVTDYICTSYLRVREDLRRDNRVRDLWRLPSFQWLSMYHDRC